MSLQEDSLTLGQVYPDLVLDIKKAMAINADPLSITKDQLIQLYLMLYPFIASDFVFRGDLAKWESDMHEEMDNKFNEHSQKLNNHMHIGNMGGNTSAPIQPLDIETWSVHPEDSNYKEGESFITDSSAYSNKITHRDPNKISSNVSNTKGTIPEKYNKELILIPFDTNFNSDNLGDNDYAGSTL